MKCLDCTLKYIWQTERIFSIRYKEHIHAIINKNTNSGYSNHMLNIGHTYRTVTDTMDAIKTGMKFRHLNAFEKYHIYKISRDKLYMNDIYSDTYNPIFQTLHDLYDRWQHTHLQERYKSGNNHTEPHRTVNTRDTRPTNENYTRRGHVSTQ
jgi:hypothetical protein